jgi:hypothetical protein
MHTTVHVRRKHFTTKSDTSGIIAIHVIRDSLNAASMLQTPVLVVASLNAPLSSLLVVLHLECLRVC